MLTIITCPRCGAKNRVDETHAAEARPVCGRCHSPLDVESSDHPITVTDDTLAPTLQNAGGKPVLVDCWAPWCGPCRMLTPTLNELAKESRGRYTIAKLNVDENPATASRFNISSIPAMLIFKNGQLADTLIGLQPKTAIAARLAQVAG